MSTWKLQKLCYYSQAWSLAWTEQPLFPEDFQAWSNGPVCYELFREHEGRFVVSSKDIPEELESGSPLTNEQKDTIDQVLNDYGDMEPYELQEQTYQEAPWKDAWGDLPFGSKCQNVISKAAIGMYYGGL